MAIEFTINSPFLMQWHIHIQAKPHVKRHILGQLERCVEGLKLETTVNKRSSARQFLVGISIESCAAMQGVSSGIGYGLKYQVEPQSILLILLLSISNRSFKPYNLFFQARCISDVKADTDHTSFITGTLSLREENEVFFVNF